MNLKDRVPVEPLEEERLVRIERAIVAALPASPARPSRARLAIPLVLAAAAAAAVVVAWRVNARPTPSPSRGSATATDNRTDLAASTAPVAISGGPAGTRVDLGDAVITVGGGAAAGATFEVTRPGGGVSIELAAGAIELEVASRAGRAPLVVHAGDVDVIVVGTRFSVDRREDDVIVEVSEGVVRVERGGEVDTLGAGESWSRSSKLAVVAGTVPATHDGTVAREGAIATGDVETPATTTDVTLRDHDADVPDAERAGGGSSGSGSGSRTTKSRPKKRPTVVDDPLGDLQRELAAERVAAPAGGGDDDDAMFARAHESPRWVNVYVKTFPRGRHLADALWMRLQTLCKKGFDDTCRAAAHTYLNKIGPSGRRGELARRVTHTR